MQLRRLVPLLGYAAALVAPATAHSKPLTAEELKVVEARLANVVPSSAKVTVSPGDTIFMEITKQIPKARMTKKPAEYEGVVTGITAPRGVVVHPRLDQFTFTPKGGEVEVMMRYAIHVDPGSKGGGRVSLAAKVIERTGLANTLVEVKKKHWVKIGGPASPSNKDLAADFHGYRHFRRLARSRAARMKKARFKLSIKDLARIGSMDRLKRKGAAQVFSFLKERRRIWIAHRHLVAASQSPNTEISSAAKTYLKNLDAKAPSGLPAIALVEQAAPPPPPAEEAKVETLEPTSVEPLAGKGGDPGAEEGLAPVTSYEPGSEGDYSGELPKSSRPREEKKEPPATADPVKPGEETPGQTKDEEEGVLSLSDDPFASRQMRRIVYIPSYNRGLVLDDPNIAHGAAVRLAWANARVQESAIASAFFFQGQVALTRQIGVELTVPVEYVNVDLDGARAVFEMGNPLLAAKYRLFLPDVLGRRPALTIRARWALPISPLNNVPPTGLGAENFTREAHFVDTYAFFLEKTALGLGASLAWRWSYLYTGFQAYTDYFFPVSDRAADQLSFLTLSYGFSVGGVFLDDMIGAYIEGRATSLLAGPRRTEFFMYFGVRGRLLDFIEPGVWVGLPLGSVSDVSGVQIGAELRFSYDMDDILDAGTFTRRDDMGVE